MKKTERSKPSAGRTSRASYRRHPMSLVQRIAVTASAVITFAILAALLAYILIMGVPNLKPGLFAWHYTSDNCSMTPAIINTLLMVVLSLLLSVPFGIGAAIYLVEYAKRGNKLVKVVRLTAETLSGIPSIVYGLFGYAVLRHRPEHGQVACWQARCTLAIMVLPDHPAHDGGGPEGRARFVTARAASASARASCARCSASCCPRPCRASSPASFWPSAASSARRPPSSLRPAPFSGVAGGLSWNPAARLRCTCTALLNEGLHTQRGLCHGGRAAGHGHRHQRAVRRRWQSELPGARSERNRKEFHMEQDKIVIERPQSLVRQLSRRSRTSTSDMPANEITAFIGPSGCGKSTLLKSLNRMNDLVEGCRIDGHRHAGRRGYLRPRNGREPAAQARRHGLPKAQPLPHEHL